MSRASERYRYNPSGAKCTYGFDNYHSRTFRNYCGRIVGQVGYHDSCGRCDGRCGPTNGCQCRSCYELDEEAKRRMSFLLRNLGEPLQGGNKLEITLDGETIQVSCNNSSPHSQFDERRRSHYRFYCSRRMGSNDYHNRCPSCDGRCGPGNGCQCTSCYQMELDYEQYLLNSSIPNLPAVPVQPQTQSTTVEAEIASFTSLNQCNVFQTKLDQWTALLQTKKEEIIARQPQELCAICLDQRKSMALVPCGHVCLCDGCAEVVMNRPRRTCPLCTQAVESRMRVYF